MHTEYVEEPNEQDDLDLNEEEIIDDEFVEEDGPIDTDDEDSGDDEDSPETIDAPEDFAIEIPVRTLDGGVVEQVFDSETLSDLVTKGVHYDQLLTHAENFQRQAQQSKALVDFVAGDPILARMTYMRANGYTPSDILQDIQQIMNNMNQNTNTDPYLDELDDTQKQIYLKVKEEEARRLQLEQQLQTLQNERLVDSVANHNSKVFDEALNETGLDYSGNADIKKIQTAIAELYPNIDPRTTKFTKQQAKAILSNAGLNRRGSKTSAKIEQVNKAKQAPRVVGGSKSSGTNKRQVQQKLGNTIEERRKALLGLGF
jgi:hypothetical protein